MAECTLAALVGVVLGSALGAGVPARTILRVFSNRSAEATEKLDTILRALEDEGHLK